MTVYEVVKRALSDWPTAYESDGRVRLPTHCLYPSNSAVMVTIEGGRESFIVHDDGGAIDEVSGISGRLKNAHRLVGHVIRSYGLKIDDSGVIRSPLVKIDELLGTIILVANASKEAADELVLRIQPKTPHNFREALARLLEIRFPRHVIRNHIIVGASNKPHRFDHAVEIDDKRKLLIDAVVNDSSSINAAVVANLDVSRIGPEAFEQRIVYDDQEPWSSADLSLLRVGATPIAFSRLNDVLDRIAA